MGSPHAWGKLEAQGRHFAAREEASLHKMAILHMHIGRAHVGNIACTGKVCRMEFDIKREPSFSFSTCVFHD